MNTFYKIKLNIFLSIAFTILFFAINYFFIKKNIFSVDNILIIFFINFIISLFKSFIIKIIFFGFINVIIFTELIHYLYFGTFLNSFEIWLFFYQCNEIFNSIDFYSYIKFIPALLASIFLFSIIYLLLKKYNKRLFHIKYLHFVVFVLIAIWPAEIFFRNRNTGLIIHETKHILRTGLECYFGFFGNVLPHKIINKSKTDKIKPTPKPDKTTNNNIVLIIGESLNPKHMHLFGYKKNNTPFLDSLFKENKIIKQLGISKGVCTYTALANFLNLTDSIAQAAQIFSQNTSLFKLAKQAGYKTFFISMQSDNAVSVIKDILGAGFIDIYKTAKNVNNKIANDDNIYDENILKELKKINLNKDKNFIIFQMSGSHADYKYRYPKTFNKFLPKNYEYPKTAFYDNSVLYTDFILNEIIKYLQKISSKKTYFFFVSDHSEKTGEDRGIFGHCNLFKEVITVPFIYSAINDSIKSDYKQSIITQKNISYMIAKKLGYKYNYDYCGTAFCSEFDLYSKTNYAIIKYNKDSIIKIIKK